MSLFTTAHLKKHAIKLACVGISTSLLLACTTPNGSGGSTTGPENSFEIKNERLTECAQKVGKLKVMGNRSSQFTTSIVSPGAFKHDYKVITIDTTALGAGTLYISGKLGSGSEGSFALMGSSPGYPCSGEGSPAHSQATNLKPGSSFELKHSFVKGEIYHILAEGSWHDEKGSTNTVDWTVRVSS